MAALLHPLGMKNPNTKSKNGSSPSPESPPEVEPSAPNNPAKGNAAKWTPEVWGAGWTGLPNALIEGKARLDISDAEFVVLVYLVRRWYTRDAELFPSRETIGKATGKSVRAVQRALDRLVAGGFLSKKSRRLVKTGNYTSNTYLLDGLVEALKPIAADLSKANKERKERDEAGASGVRKKKARRTT